MIVKFSKSLIMKIILITLLLIIVLLTFIRVQKILTLQNFAENIFSELKNNNGIIKFDDKNINVKEITLKKDKTLKGILNNFGYELNVDSVYQIGEFYDLYDITLKLNSITDKSIYGTVNNTVRINSSNVDKQNCMFVVYDINNEENILVETISKSGIYRISMSKPVKENYDFLYWQDKKGNIYYPSDKLKITEKDIQQEKDLILYAIWEEKYDTSKEKVNNIQDIIKSPTLIFGSNWYKAKTDKSKITKIKFLDEYNATEYIETWEANIFNSGKITCYIVNEMELIVSGSGKGKIYFNTDSTEVFANFTNVVNIEGMELLDTSNVTIMDGMFYNCQKLRQINLSNFNTKNVTSMNKMFSGCSSLKKIDLSTFNTNKVKNMGEMFKGCSNLASLNLSNFRTNKVISMANMFSGCSNLASLDLSNFNTSEVTTMAYMFKDCTNLNNLNLSSFNTSKVTNMKSMFFNCNSLTSLDLSNFNTSEVTTMAYMFKDCTNIIKLNLDNFNTKKSNNLRNMFNGMIRLEEITLGENFSFLGDGTTNCSLPKPDKNYISDADGFWHTKSKKNYSIDNIPNNVANTYYAVL